MSNKFFLFILFFICYHSLKAQGGMYLSYNDFFNDKLVVEHDYGGEVQRDFKYYRVVFEDTDGNETVYKPNKVKYWGFRIGGTVYRFDDKHNPYLMQHQGKYCVYVPLNRTARMVGSELVYDYHSLVPKYSKGVKGELVSISKKNLKDFFKGKSEWENKLKSKPANYQNMIDLVIEYSEG